MTDREIFGSMLLQLENSRGKVKKVGEGFYSTDFLTAVVMHAQSRVIMARTGLDELSVLERLAIDVLLDAFYIPRK